MNIQIQFCFSFFKEELFRSKKKLSKGKKKSKQQNEDLFEEELKDFLEAIPRPKLINLLPCKIVKSVVWTVRSVPGWLAALVGMVRDLGKKEPCVLEEDKCQDD